MHRRTSLLSLFVLAGGLACQPQVHEQEEAPEIGGPSEPRCGVSESPRLVRLTHRQYRNSVRDLLHIDGDPSAAFPPDPEFSGFDNNAKLLTVSDRLARDYRRSAETLAAEVAGNPDKLLTIAPCAGETADRACALEFIADFGPRAYRRPLSPAELEELASIYDLAAGAYAQGSALEQGIRLLLEGFLQSPHFLYRVELSRVPSSQGSERDELVALSGYEVATRLSFLLWNSIPDDELLAAAAAGELGAPEAIAAHARRMLADSRASDVVEDFHEQWLEADAFDDLAKDPDRFPAFADEGSHEMSIAMREELRRFVDHVVLELDSDYATLMQADFTFANADLAEIYGVQGPTGAQLELVSLPAAERAGLLTQSGFLAAHADIDASSPIQRGVFVQRQILCAALPDPPSDIDTSLPPLDGDLETTRQQVEYATGAPACATCHGIINPPGFGLESFDAVGAWRDSQNGVDIDAAASLVVDGEEIAFDGPVELAAALAEHPRAERCYVTQWVRYASGRHENAEDSCSIESLDQKMRDEGLSIKELLVALTQTRAFRFRPVDECD